MAATKIFILIFIFLVTCSQPALIASRPRRHSFIKQPGSSSSGDGSPTTRFFTLTHASTTRHPSTTSPIPLNDTSYIIPTPPVLHNEDLIRKAERRNTADLSTSSSPPAPSISNDALYTDEPFTTPPAPVIQNGGLHSATPLPNPTSSLPSISTKGKSSASMVEHGSRSAPGHTDLLQTTPAPQ